MIFITLFYYNSSSHILYKIYFIYPYSDSPLSFLFFSFLYPHLKLFFFLFTLLILSHQLTTPKTLPSSPTASLSILFLLSSPSYTLHTPTITTSPFHRTSVHLLLLPFRPRITPTAAHFFRPRTMLNVRTPAYMRLLLTTTFYY